MKAPIVYAGCSALALSLVMAACGSETTDSTFQNPASQGDASLGEGVSREFGDASLLGDTRASDRIDVDAFWSQDPPPQWCGPDGGGTPPVVPGGTPECPDDKNREGCPCTDVGKTAACWPGLRVNRKLGICKDGVTTCIGTGEFKKTWGPCEGYVLPQAGATKGKGACKCFSAGQWALANTSPCFIGSGSNYEGAVATFMENGAAKCPTNITIPPQPEPGTNFSENTLQVDCAGQFKLCYELKAGDAQNPKPTDCTIAKVCTDAFYPTAGQVLNMPPLASWSSSDAACATAFATTGGYGEMSVIGKSVLCDTVDDGSGHPYVFNRVQYCKLLCNANPSLPGCQNCGNGGSGSF